MYVPLFNSFDEDSVHHTITLQFIMTGHIELAHKRCRLFLIWCFKRQWPETKKLSYVWYPTSISLLWTLLVSVPVADSLNAWGNWESGPLNNYSFALHLREAEGGNNLDQRTHLLIRRIISFGPPHPPICAQWGTLTDVRPSDSVRVDTCQWACWE